MSWRITSESDSILLIIISDGKPTEKQLKYLNDLADKLGLGEEEKEGFKELSKKQVSDKLTELYKECKKREIE